MKIHLLPFFILNIFFSIKHPDKIILFNSLLAIISIISVSFILKSKLINHLNESIDVLHEIAEGEGDLTLRVGKNLNDEIGELSRWFDKFLNAQMLIVNRIGRASKDTENSTYYLSNLNLKVKSNIENIEKSIKKIISSSEKQNNVFQESNESIISASNSVKEISKLSNEITNKTKETNEKAIKSAKEIKEVIEIIEELDSTMGKTLSSIEILKTYSQKIHDVIGVIENISKQTHYFEKRTSLVIN